MFKNENAVIYARFSSSSQREESIEDQLRVCSEYVQREGYSIVGTYCDYAISGRTDDRPEFLRMIQDSKKKLFNHILVYRLDRFARNRVDSVVYKAQLAKQKVNVISATECIPEGSNGMLMEALHEALAQKYSDDLSQIIRRGQEGNAESCRSNGAYPFGYKVNKETRRLEIDQAKATIINHIFHMIAEGASYSQALDYSAGMGYKRSKNWIYQVLRNERYKGIYIYKDHRVEGGLPAIISPELFAAANATRTRHLKHTSSPSLKFLLSSKLRCPKCGNICSGSTAVGRHGGKYRYYICAGKKRLHQCDEADLRADFIEEQVVGMLYALILSDQVCSKIIDAAVSILEKEDPTKAEIAALTTKLKEVEKKVNNIMAAIEAGIFTEITRSRLQNLEEEKRSLQQSIVKEKLKAPTLTRDQLEFYFDKLRAGDAKDRHFQQYMIQNFLSCCYYNDGQITIIINLSGEESSHTAKPLGHVLGFDQRSKWWR